ncbi:MAG: hypothetical protein U9P12_01005, partial [Verrucomicrobiota bacterium]|nr:hypothetical protein [Verrucomicrobiota bacterium]
NITGKIRGDTHFQTAGNPLDPHARFLSDMPRDYFLAVISFLEEPKVSAQKCLIPQANRPVCQVPENGSQPAPQSLQRLLIERSQVASPSLEKKQPGI